ncbi:MAG: AraC family ligand binding domain-containing protein, partial [Thermoguttaceae bacterium]|nr:AraC family ligand binding domain-containing protein [Thermoguttaceae bacterium]
MSFFQKNSPPTKANFLPITQQELKWNLYVTGAGFDDMQPGRVFVNEGRPELYRLEQYKNRVLPEYVFLYIADGIGQYYSDMGGSLTVKKGDFFILFPGSEHQLTPDKEIGWKDIWITANGPYIHSLTQNGILDPRHP